MKKILIALGLALLALGAFQLGQHRPQTSATPSAELSAKAVSALFAMRLADSKGQTQAISQWQGRMLVVNFWATWCPPCREEMPIFSRLNENYASRNVQFLGLALDELDKVRQFAANHPVSYPLLSGGSELTELSKQLGNTRLALPFTVIIDPQGKVLHSKLGRISEAEMQGLIESALANKR